MSSGTEFFKQDYYKLFGVSKTASTTQIKKAYLKKCKTEHPDRGGNVERFKHLKKAYETLTDDEKRGIYDKYGEEGLKKHEQGGFGGGGGGDLGDFLARAFGMGEMGGSGGGQQREPTGEDMQFRLGVTLPDLYNGKKVPLNFRRRELCPGCKGTGATKKGAAVTCSSCRGQGIRTIRRQIGPGMVQQFRTSCPECDGEGRCIDPKFRCKGCNGQRMSMKEVEIEAQIPPGSQDGEKIVLKGEAHQIPDGKPGSIILHLKEVESKQNPCPFERRGDDLIFEKKVSLAEAIIGYKFTLEHMDGRKLVIQNEANSIVTPGGMHVIPDEGMPRKENKHLKGSLFIKFEVVFPKASQITPEFKAEIKKLLPDLDPVDTNDGEDIEAIPWNPRTDPPPGANDHSTGHGALYSSDDDHMGGGGGAQTCAHQ
eukprot:CAMPEP_0201548220 /NCGR_PEP_ID=MMETSP0173_2-20130828/4752_1 /ASSEMBLY_ACC=CAM_ASM_000268 /TAXON_ID=218659 /ORGANISM="Vexillifera sp., Strain DIVA3 564/2" /LENGTH=424 /DNA_ID=CAMNT_0047957533 /DNA_START=56 /DNA_END=1330 /DNA_ORIENTATION=+